MWESIAIDFSGTVNDVNIADGCIDLLVNVLAQSVFDTGLSKTDFNFLSRLPEHYIGFRLKQAVFFVLTGREATAAMDQVLFIEEVDVRFDTPLFLRSRLKK